MANSTQTGSASIIQMDGFHIPNRKLCTMQVPPTWAADCDLVSGAAVKGSPHTIDAQGFASALSSLQVHRRTQTCPVYDRSLHDPRWHAVKVPPSCRLLLAEGLYMLLGSRRDAEGSPWRHVHAACDQHWASWVPQYDSFLRICHRKVTVGGRSLAEVVQHWGRSEQPTWRLLAPSMLRADVIMQSSGGVLWCMLPSTAAPEWAPPHSPPGTALGCAAGACMAMHSHSSQAQHAMEAAFASMPAIHSSVHVCGCLLHAWCNRAAWGTAGASDFVMAGRGVVFDAGVLDAVHCSYLLLKQHTHVHHVCVDVLSGPPPCSPGAYRVWVSRAPAPPPWRCMCSRTAPLAVHVQPHRQKQQDKYKHFNIY